MYLMRAKIARWGNSLAVRLPKAAVESAGLREGDLVDVHEADGELRIARAERVDIESLIAALRPETFHELVDWGGPVGEEFW